MVSVNPPPLVRNRPCGKISRAVLIKQGIFNAVPFLNLSWTILSRVATYNWVPGYPMNGNPLNQ